MTDCAPLSALDRSRGCLLGLAVGDALGTTLEFGPRREPGAYHTAITGGGPFRLPAGVWTDDTSMALALADTLIEGSGYLSRDLLLTLFVRWYRKGTYSPTGRCFDIGNQTRSALETFERTNSVHNNDYAQLQGNGGIMRLAPAAIAAKSPEDALTLAGRQSTTTHGSPLCIEYAGYLGILLQHILRRGELPIITNRCMRLPERTRDEVVSDGHVVNCYEAALWCVTTTSSFRDAVVEAANLGGDADTTAAVAGQIAGALYGASGIPAEWLDVLAWRADIQERADKLHVLSGRR